MKLAFIGNMNNMPLVYARELRALGHHVDFYVDADPKDKLSRPEYRYPEYSTYPDWMIDTPVRLSLLSYGLAGIFLRKLIRQINAQRYDGIVLNGAAVSLGIHLRAPKFAILGGADLDVLCDPRTLNPLRMVRTFGPASGIARLAIYSKFIARQRKGLKACSGFNYFPKGINPRGEELIATLFKDRMPYRLEIRGVDVVQHDYVEPTGSYGNDVTILVPVRFLWREPLPAGFGPYENKRNDIIIHGLARYLKSSGRSPRIVLVEKGPDVEASKRLAVELGIADNLEWLPEMSLSEIYRCYARADIVFDQLGEHIIGAVTLDAMLIGRPVITNARPEIFDSIILGENPICHARTAEDIEAWLNKLVDDPELRRQIGIRSRQFAKDHFSARATAEMIEQFFARYSRGQSTD